MPSWGTSGVTASNFPLYSPTIPSACETTLWPRVHTSVHPFPAPIRVQRRVQVVQRNRTERRLRARDLDALPAGIHQDGGGLRFRVEPTGSRSWVLRLTIKGRSCTKGLGPYPLVMCGRRPCVKC
jgi:hypothetical protein